MDSGGDRLSRLGDTVLGHILSFLPSTEAARAATLSRRWRHVFAAVHTASFRESEDPLAIGYRWWKRYDSNYSRPRDEDDVRAPLFVTAVGAALHGRDRGARAAAVPLRALHVAFDEFGFLGGDAKKAVDGWLTYARYHTGDALQIDLRLGDDPICKRAYTLRPRVPDDDAEDGGGQEQDLGPHDMDAEESEDSEDETEESEDSEDEGSASPPKRMRKDDGGYEAAGVESRSPPLPAEPGEPSPGLTQYVVPRSLFSCDALRALRLGSCWLDLPSAIALPCLDTLHLTRVDGRTGAVQRLVSACPRLADLTLEACSGLTEISVVDARLRRLAVRCCHKLATVAVASSELRAFEYRGAVPGPSFLTLHVPRSKVSFCTVDLCGAEQADQPALASLVGFLRLFVGVERLHLTSARLGCGVSHAHPSDGSHICNWECVFGHGIISSTLELPSFPALRNLELTGMLPDGDTTVITAVTRILQRTPSLETLSLFFLPEPHPVPKNHYWCTDVDEEGLHAAHKLRYNQHARLTVPPDVEIPASLTERTKEINLVHYQGAMAQRALAKFLLCNAPVVDEVYCEFAPGPLLMQTKLMAEVRGWVVNKSANMTFF
ncbi:hypothetical protein BS78_05G225800 [Paspalum vaginatum]|nr:hypothetical protein BS78_05G225800 [Paspalum vaginatum]